eukprot:gene5942-8047_t
MKKIIASFALFSFTNTICIAQVGIGTSSPDKSAVLDVSSTTKGFLLPRMTAAQKDLIGAPKKGLMIYQTDAAEGLYIFNGSVWVIANGAGGSGSYVDLISTQTVGGLKYFLSDINANGLTIGNGGGNIEYNTAVGNNVMMSNTTGTFNTAIGFQALNINTLGDGNSATGFQSLFSNLSGSQNTGNGFQSLFLNSTGKNNT